MIMRKLSAAAGLAMCTLSMPAHATNSWVCSGNNTWTNAGCWSRGVFPGYEDIYITSNTSSYVISAASNLGAPTSQITLSNIVVQNTGGGFADLDISNSHLRSTNDVIIGNTGRGILDLINNGSLQVDRDLQLGLGGGGHGEVWLHDGSSVRVNNVEIIGNQSYGFFSQDGASSLHGVNNTLYLGYNAGVSGGYRLNAGTLNALGTYEVLGEYGDGGFEQNGGMHNANNILMGQRAGAYGFYRLSGGTLNASSMTVGNGGLGEFLQLGGTHTLSSDLYIGSNSSRYDLKAGALQVGRDLVVATGGAGSVASFTQSGGTNAVARDLHLGLNAGSSGSYALSNTGSLTVGAGGTAYIGNMGQGTFTQNGGSFNAGNALYLGLQTGGEGHYNLQLGTLAAGADLVVGYAGNGVFTQAGGSTTAARYLSLGALLGGTGAYDQSAGTNSSTYLTIGTRGTGTYTQSGGTNTVAGGMWMGELGAAQGTYNLTGGALNNASFLAVGNQGVGIFNHSGGTHSVDAFLMAMASPSSVGTYNLSDTGVLVARSEVVGQLGAATFQQTGGSNSVGEDLFVGYNTGSNGAYNLGGTGSLTVGAGGNAIIGNEGQGAFTQSGGTFTVANALYLALHGSGVGSYDLSAGGLSVNAESIGVRGIGTFNQSGGTNNINANLGLGENVGSNGTYNLSDGILSSTAGTYVGVNGTGIFNQTGGTHNVANLTVGQGVGSSGAYNLSGTGVLAASNITVGMNGGHTGTFTQTAGSNTVTGTLQIANNLADPASPNLYDLKGGSLNAGNIVNEGRFNFSGGTLTADIRNTGDINFSGVGIRSVDGDVVNNGQMDVASATVAQFNGAVSGAGVITGMGTSIFRSGFEAGDTVTTIADAAILGDAIFGTTNVFNVDLGGVLAGEYDTVSIFGDTQLGGALSVDFVNGYTLHAGDYFDILFASSYSGTFANLLAPTTLDGLTLSLVYGSNYVRLEASAVPVPAAAWLFGSGLIGFVGVARPKAVKFHRMRGGFPSRRISPRGRL